MGSTLTADLIRDVFDVNARVTGLSSAAIVDFSDPDYDGDIQVQEAGDDDLALPQEEVMARINNVLREALDDLQNG